MIQGLWLHWEEWSHMITIKLPKGTTVFLEDADQDLTRYKWNHLEGYAYRQVGSRRDRSTILMHREVMERVLNRSLAIDEHVDHINGNRSDNRRSNLRTVTRSQNMMNRGRTRLNPIGFKGVRKKPDLLLRPYTSVITLDSKRFFIGYFSSPEEAAWMYDQWANALHSEYARLNFDYVEVEAQI